MGLWTRIKKWLTEPVYEGHQPKPNREDDKPKEPSVSSRKEEATQAGVPFVEVVEFIVDSADPNTGTFVLDYNDKFVLNLIRAGYQLKKTDTERDIVDRWFNTVCRNIALEVYEQEQADPSKREATNDLRVVGRRDLGNGRSEIS